MINSIPEFIVHYSRGEPFRSITSLDNIEFATILSKLNNTNTWGLSRFSDQHYISQRREVEAQLRNQFIEMGGQPVLENPIYFFLGRHFQFEENVRNVGYIISLQDLDPSSVSFSYGDSMVCFHLENRRQAGDKYLNPLCEKLYSLQTLSQLFANHNFPKIDPLHIEAHLWISPDRNTVRTLS